MARLDPRRLPDDVLAFLVERHLATLTTLRADGSPHVVPVGFTFDPEGATVRIITSARSVKAGNAARAGRAAVCQADGARWLTLEGLVRVSSDPAEVAVAVSAYAQRYRQPRERTDRVAILIVVDRVLTGSRMAR